MPAMPATEAARTRAVPRRRYVDTRSLFDMTISLSHLFLDTADSSQLISKYRDWEYDTLPFVTRNRITSIIFFFVFICETFA